MQLTEVAWYRTTVARKFGSKGLPRKNEEFFKVWLEQVRFEIRLTSAVKYRVLGPIGFIGFHIQSGELKWKSCIWVYGLTSSTTATIVAATTAVAAAAAARVCKNTGV